MEPRSGQSQGILGSLRRLVQTFLAIAQNRLELLLVEFQEERRQFFEALLLAGIVLVLGTMTLAVLTCTIVVLCVQFNRLDLLLGLALLYLVGTIFAFLRLRTRLRNWTPFAATLDELKKDLTCLEEKS
jgi:uncharacterized membrane protein YqjE